MSGQAAGRQGGDRAAQSISAGGNRIMFDYFTLDGVTNTDPDFATYVVLPSIDAIQEFKVQTGVYPAEFGHQATQINVLTKSGGNAYHGALFEFVRNDKFDAVPLRFHRQPRPPSRRSNGTITVSKWTVRCEFRNCSTGATGCSSWRTTNGRPSARTRQGTYSVPTSAMFARRLQRLAHDDLRSEHGRERRNQDAVPGQQDSLEPDRSDLEEVPELLCPFQPAGPVEQLHPDELFSQQPGRVHSAHGLCRIGEIAVDGTI